jgi:hypothetical protein
LTSVGKIRVPTGFGTISKEIRLLSLSQAAQDINVSPNAPRFGPEWISDEVDRAYRDAVSNRLEGFAHVSAQAFAANAAKIKPLANCFVWGDSYYMIWKLHDLVVPEVLNAIALAPHEGWFAALITLPPTPNEDVARWLQDMFHLRLLGATRQWGIVYPPPIDIDLDGNIAVCDGAGFVLGFRDAAESKSGNSTLSVVTTAGEVEISVKGGTESLIYVSRDAPDALDSLRLQWDEMELPSIKAAQIADAVVQLPVVMLRLHDVGADRDVEIPYHRKEARDALDRIRQGQAELVSISVPCRLIGHLERRNGDGPWIQTMSFSDAGALQCGGTWMLSAVQLRIIAEALGDLDSNFRLSFGVFGQYSAAARSRRIVTKQRLSPDTRRRLIWYCRASGQALTASRRAIDFATDKELVEVFGRALPSPHLIAHRNLLLQRVRVESGARGAP